MILRPLKTNKRTQSFGQSNACALVKDNKPVRPFEIISKKGDRCPVFYDDFYKLLGMKGHNGDDWKAFKGEPLFFSGLFDGWMKTEIDKDGGIGVDVISNKPLIDGHHVKLRHWHLDKVVGYDNKPITTGDLIGYCGSTGASSGPHLHFSLKLCREDGETIKRFNGYGGAIDMSEYFNNAFILDYMKIKYKLTIGQLLRKYLLQLGYQQS